MTDETSPREHLSALIALAPRALRALWIGGIVLVIGLGVTVAWTLSTAHLYRSEAVVAYDHGVRTSTRGYDATATRRARSAGGCATC